MVNLKTYLSPAADELRRMKADGSLDKCYAWIVQRVGEFEIGLSACGQLVANGEAYSERKILMMLTADTKRKFPSMTNKLREHLVKHAWKLLVKKAHEELKKDA